MPPLSSLASEISPMASLIAIETVEGDEIDLNKLEPSFRKATLSMAMTAICCGKILESIPSVPKTDIAMVMGSHFGEMESSFGFLKYFRESGIQRPILFQNSLHNSTLGFATIQTALVGPAMTISNDRDTARTCVECAHDLLLISPFVMVCLCDVIRGPLTEHYLTTFDFFHKFNNRAVAFLFGRSDVIAKFDLKTLATSSLDVWLT